MIKHKGTWATAVAAGWFALSTPTNAAFLAHYNATTNADVAAGGNPSDIGASKGTIVSGGRFGNAVHFGTANQASRYYTAGNIQASSGTVMFWYKADTANTDWPCLFSIGTTNFWSNPPTTNLMIRCLPLYNSTHVYVTDTSGHSYRMNPTGVGGTSWAHVAVTWSASGGTCDFKAYSNGSLTASQTGVTWSGFNFDSTMFVGCFGDWTGPGANGKLDDFAIFDTALTGDQIAAVVNSGKPIPDSIAVEGAITLQGFMGDNRTVPVTLEFRPVGGGTALLRPTFLRSDGTFHVDNVTWGTYTLAVKAYASLETVVTNVAIMQDPTVLPDPILLKAADSNGDNRIGFEDFSVLQNSYGRSGLAAPPLSRPRPFPAPCRPSSSS